MYGVELERKGMLLWCTFVFKIKVQLKVENNFFQFVSFCTVSINYLIVDLFEFNVKVLPVAPEKRILIGELIKYNMSNFDLIYRLNAATVIHKIRTVTEVQNYKQGPLQQ